MAAQLLVDFSSTDAGVRRQALLELQRRVDGAVAPRLDVVALDNGGGAAQIDFPDDVAEEQVLAVFTMAVNMAGLPESGFASGLIALSGDVSSHSRQLEYSV